MKRTPKPAAPPLADTLRAALASDWRTLAALDTLTAARGSDARRLVHEALREIKAGGAVLEERVGRAGVEVRLAPTLPAPVPDDGQPGDLSPEDIEAIRASLLEEEDDASDGAAYSPSFEIAPLSPAASARMADLIENPPAPTEALRAICRGGSPLDALKDRAAALGRPLGAAEGFALLARGTAAAREWVDLTAAEPSPALDAPATPVGQAAPVEAVGGPVAPQPGPSSRCAVCARPYARHADAAGVPYAGPEGHPFTPKPRGRPRGPIVAVDGGRAERSRADVLDAQTDPYRVEVDPALATEASMRAEAERQKAAAHVARVEAIEGVAASLAPTGAASEPETSRGEAPGEQDHETCDTDTTRPDGSNRVPALRVADTRAPGKPRVPRPRAHPVAPSDGVDQSASRVGAKDVATAGDVAAPPCRPPLCHADDIHDPSRLHAFARPLCEAHRRWVEGAGGTLAAGGLVGVVAQARSGEAC